jgi:hypothetical protein
MLNFLLELFIGKVVLCNLYRACNTELKCVTNNYIRNESGVGYNKVDEIITSILPKVMTMKKKCNGYDERYLKYYGSGMMNEKVEKEFNIYKQEKYLKMLEKLKKINGIFQAGILQEEEILPDVYEFLKDENFIAEIQSFRLMNGGLLDEWENDSWE